MLLRDPRTVVGAIAIIFVIALTFVIWYRASPSLPVPVAEAIASAPKIPVTPTAKEPDPVPEVPFVECKPRFQVGERVTSVLEDIDTGRNLSGMVTDYETPDGGGVDCLYEVSHLSTRNGGWIQIWYFGRNLR